MKPIRRSTICSSLALVGALLAFCSTALADVDQMGNGSPPQAEMMSVPTLPAGSVQLIFSCPSPVDGNMDLAWDGDHLWIADFDTVQAYRVDPRTCGVVSSIPLPRGGYPTGIAWDGNYLWSSDGFLRRVFQLDPVTGAVISSFPTPLGFPNGLEFDGTRLLSCDPNCNYDRCVPDLINTYTPGGDLLASRPAPGGYPTSIAFDGTYLWHSDNSPSTIYKLDSNTLDILASFPAPGLYPNGLAWDGATLWVADNGSDWLFQYDVGTGGNHAPVANAGPDQILECEGDWHATVTLDGSQSRDSDSTQGTNDDIVLFEWFENYGQPTQSFLGIGETLSVSLVLGEHHVTLRVTDRGDLTASDEVNVVVQDTVPPTVALSNPPRWPVLLPLTLPLDVLVLVDDGCCFPETTVQVAVAGCVVYQGPAAGGTIPLSQAELCRVAINCGIDVLIRPEVSVVATDCSNNRSAPATATLFRGSLKMSSLCGPNLFPGKPTRKGTSTEPLRTMVTKQQPGE